eukprot:208988_1
MICLRRGYTLSRCTVTRNFNIVRIRCLHSSSDSSQPLLSTDTHCHTGNIPDIPDIPFPDASNIADFIQANALGHAPWFTKLSAFQYGAGCIEQLHSVTGLPWWATISTLAVSLRFILYPVTLRFIKETQKFAVMAPSFKVEATKKFGGSINNAKTMTTREQLGLSLESLKFVREACREWDVRFRNLLPMPLIVIPAFFFVGISCRTLVYSSGNPGLTVGGPGLWWSNLLIPDPTCILPAISTLLFVAVFQPDKFSVFKSKQPGNYLKKFRVNWYQRGFQLYFLCMLPVFCNQPLGVFFFTIPFLSTVYLTRLVVRIPAVKAFIKPTFPKSKQKIAAKQMKADMIEQRSFLKLPTAKDSLIKRKVKRRKKK